MKKRRKRLLRRHAGSRDGWRHNSSNNRQQEWSNLSIIQCRRAGGRRCSNRFANQHRGAGAAGQSDRDGSGNFANQAGMDRQRDQRSRLHRGARNRFGRALRQHRGLGLELHHLHEQRVDATHDLLLHGARHKCSGGFG